MHTTYLNSFVLQTVFPLLYLLMKRHYAIMRIMRTKILSKRELQEGMQSIMYIHYAAFYRIEDLKRASVLSPAVIFYANLICRQLLSSKTRFRGTVTKLRFWDCGLFISSQIALPSDMLVIQFKYYDDRNALWSVDYVRSLDPQVIPYNDDNEDQNVQPGDVLNHGYKDELSLDCSVYDGHSIDYIPNCRDVDSPVNDMYAPRLFAYLGCSNF
jgi:hypothetical protein